jgi:hypothetical protein
MSTIASKSFENQILETFNDCIEKISKKLQNNFDPNESKSLSLFRQFCTALNARFNWLKQLKKDNNSAANIMKNAKSITSKLSETTRVSKHSENKQSNRLSRMNKSQKNKNTKNSDNRWLELLDSKECETQPEVPYGLLRGKSE